VLAGSRTVTVQKKGLQELAAYRLPNQTNRLALVFDPLADGVPFTFGLEIFEPGHKTAPHTHPSSQELFFILAGACPYKC
jgi:quercetin dioxygenase-like cupin family protein